MFQGKTILAEETKTQGQIIYTHTEESWTLVLREWPQTKCIEGHHLAWWWKNYLKTYVKKKNSLFRRISHGILWKGNPCQLNWNPILWIHSILMLWYENKMNVLVLSFGRYITNSYGFSYAVFYYMVELVGGVRFHIVHTYTKKKKNKRKQACGCKLVVWGIFFSGPVWIIIILWTCL